MFSWAVPPWSVNPSLAPQGALTESICLPRSGCDITNNPSADQDLYFTHCTVTITAVLKLWRNYYLVPSKIHVPTNLQAQLHNTFFYNILDYWYANVFFLIPVPRKKNWAHVCVVEAVDEFKKPKKKNPTPTAVNLLPVTGARCQWLHELWASSSTLSQGDSCSRFCNN